MKPTAKQLYESWVKLNARQQALGRKVLEMLAHPDATPEQIQDVAARYRASAQSIREVQERTVKALHKLQPRGYCLFNYANEVQSDKVAQ